MLSAEELAQHASEDDCWLAIHGKVYNVSEYLVDHPGGLDVMIEHAGKDATEEFEYYGHSNKAREQMAKFVVGDFEGGDQQPVEETGAVVTNGAAPKAKPLPIKIVQALLPLLLVVLAFAVKMYADAPARSA